MTPDQPVTPDQPMAPDQLVTPDQPMAPAPPVGPPPGWYQDPRDQSRRRWWDGQTWTAKAEVVPQPASTKATFAAGAAWGAGAGLLLVGFAHAHSSGSASYVAGGSLATGVMAGLGAAALAVALRHRWRWWLFPPVVVALWFALFFLQHIDDLTSPLTPAAPRMTLSAPDRVGELERIDNPDVEAARKQAEEQLGSDASSLIMAPYGRPGEEAVIVFTGTNLNPGREVDDQSAESPDKTVRDTLGGAGAKDTEYADPGDLGGAMMCGTAVVNNRGSYVCAWSTTGVLGMLIMVDEADRASAIARTREFRGLAEHPASP